jgi:hypothetical protein
VSGAWRICKKEKTGNVLSGLVEKIEKTPERGVFFIKTRQKEAKKP